MLRVGVIVFIKFCCIMVQSKSDWQDMFWCRKKMRYYILLLSTGLAMIDKTCGNCHPISISWPGIWQLETNVTIVADGYCIDINILTLSPQTLLVLVLTTGPCQRCTINMAPWIFSTSSSTLLCGSLYTPSCRSTSGR